MAISFDEKKIDKQQHKSTAHSEHRKNHQRRDDAEFVLYLLDVVGNLIVFHKANEGIRTLDHRFGKPRLYR